MNIIFTDIDSVLNTLKTCRETLGTDELNIDADKVRLLSEIAKLTNSKIVITSSWKLNWTHKDCIRLRKLFLSYGIILDKTPNIPNKSNGKGQDMWKEYDIKEYLRRHKEIRNFCIIDDETYDLESLRDYLILVKDNIDEYGNGGLMECHKDEIIKKLTRNQN